MATMGLECVILACGYGNRANPVVSCAKFDAHTHCHCQVIRVSCIRGVNHTKGTICAKFDAHTYHHCQEIHNNKYSMGKLLVAMATNEVDSV